MRLEVIQQAVQIKVTDAHVWCVLSSAEQSWILFLPIHE